jgi:YVTN family beta-propeller protein
LLVKRADRVIEFRLLGAFEAVEGERPVALGGPKPMALLVVLLLRRGEVVSSDRLIDALWGERPPSSAAKVVHGYVSHLRKALGEGVLVTRGRGYLIETAPGQVDVDRFEVLAAEGRRLLGSGDAAAASEQLREGLALWRGPPLADFAYEPFAQSEIARLEEARLAALEDRIDAELALGEHAALVGELEALVREHPSRERLQGQLMLALYRCGRQADALESYRKARRSLVEELGLEPGRALQELEQAILAQDPAIDAPAQAARRQPAIIARGRRGGVLLAAGGVLLLAAAIAAAAVALTGGGSRVTAVANSVAVIDPRSNSVVSQTVVGAAPGSIAAGVRGVWVVNTDDHTIANIDPASRRVVRYLQFGDSVDGVAADSGALWMVDSTRGVASRIDPTFGTVVPPPVAVGDQKAGFNGPPNAIALDNGTTWVANNAAAVMRIGADGSVSRIDVGNDPSGIAIGGGATWVSDESDNTVSRIDSAGSVTASPVGPGASGIAFGDGSVWVAETLSDSLVRIDPATGSVRATITVGSRPRGVAFGVGSVWVANSGDGTVSRVDPRTDRVITIPVGQSPQALVVTRGVVWVSVAARPAPLSSSPGPPGVLRVVREPPFFSTDPALETFDPQALGMYYATCAGLLTYPDRPAPQGTQLVPEVAQAMPNVSADGRTYTFIVRKGFRFSPPSGAAVTAATFKHTIERALGPKLGGYTPIYMGDIVGMPAFSAGKSAHLAGVTASGDRLQIRLTAPSPDFSARIATLNFCATPDDTPLTAQRQRIPSAGPYYVASSSPDQVVLARNPNYHGSRPRIPRQIVYSFGVGLPAAVHQVEAGRSDYLDAAPFNNSAAASALLDKLEQRYGPASTAARTGHQRYFVNPWLDLEYLQFNTTRPLFASARMRRAVNYAIDRRALVEHHFNFNGGRATDHYLVPGIPGSRPLDVYPLGGPDLTKARELAGGVHANATLYTLTGSTQFADDARIIQTDLAAVGITVTTIQLPAPTFFARVAKPGEPWDIATANWGADFADPFTMINELFDPAFAAVNFSRFNNPVLIARMRQAAKLSGARRLQAYVRLDEDLTRNDPPVAAWGNGTFRDFFSPRVGCQIYQPIYGLDVGSVCLRP